MTTWEIDALKEHMKSRSDGRILPQVQELLIREAAAKVEARETGYLHPSEICKDNWCPRSSYYSLTGVPLEKPAEVYRMQTLNIFEEGNSIHDKWQQWMWRAGILRGRFRCRVCRHGWLDKSPTACPECGSDVLKYEEVPVFSERYHVIGHADAELDDGEGENALVEVKSIGLGTLRFEAPRLLKQYEDGDLTLNKLWGEIKRPFPTHRRQGVLYLHFRGLHTIQYIYEWKPSQAYKEFTISYDSATIAPILTGCLSVAKALREHRPPKRPEWAHPDAKLCEKDCSFYKHCWGGDDHDKTDSPVEPPKRRRRIIRGGTPSA